MSSDAHDNHASATSSIEMQMKSFQTRLLLEKNPSRIIRCSLLIGRKVNHQPALCLFQNETITCEVGRYPCVAHIERQTAKNWRKEKVQSDRSKEKMENVFNVSTMMCVLSIDRYTQR